MKYHSQNPVNPDIQTYSLGTIDTHVHSKHSCDSHMDPADAVKAARANGLAALVFAEHADFDPADEGYGFYDAEAIHKTISGFRSPDSEFRIYRGIEVTYQPQYENEIREFIRAGRFDFVIGSVHLVGSDDISRPEQREQYFSMRTQQQAYGDYLDEVEKLVASGLFDCLGHLDLCKRHGHRYYGSLDWKILEAQMRRILQALVRTGIYLEMNTSGLRQDPGEPYPSIEVIHEYRAMGGKKLTLGSDAHSPEHVGYRFPEMCETLKAEYRIHNTRQSRI